MTKRVTKVTKTKNNTFVVFPEGDFDGYARLYTTSSEEEAAREAFNEGLVEEGETICVLPFTNPTVYQLAIRKVEKVK